MKPGFLIIIPIIILTSCRSNPKSSGQTTIFPKKDTNISTNNFIGFDSIEARRQRLLDTNYSFLNKLLDSSLDLAYKQGFEKPFNVTLDTNVFHFKKMYATISFGPLFSNDRKHLVIKRFINEYTDYETSLYSDIYLFDKNSFRKVAADTSAIGYYEDHYEDVNHDGYQDYILQSYSGAGCCPRNLEMAYLYNHHNGHFKAVDLFNREVDSSTNFFYETSYGLGKFINLYKYKWAGLKKNLVEEIYATPAGEGKEPTSYTQIIYPSQKKQRLKKLPGDFRKLKMAEYITEL